MAPRGLAVAVGMVGEAVAGGGGKGPLAPVRMAEPSLAIDGQSPVAIQRVIGGICAKGALAVLRQALATDGVMVGGGTGTMKAAVAMTARAATEMRPESACVTIGKPARRG
jgi:hypothetical protein